MTPSHRKTSVVAVGPRLPWQPSLAERWKNFGLTEEGWMTLTEVLFPAAQDANSINLVLSYCATRKLDPFKKPVHIVPVWSARANRLVDTVWPSITEHRITAHRTGQYAGLSEPEYGPTEERAFTGRIKDYAKDGTSKFVDKEIVVAFPLWVKMTCFRMVQGQPRGFAVMIHWLESYGKIGNTDLPNPMWERRPFDQAEKVTESRALRKAFPEELSGPTAEEMEGQVLHDALDGPIIDGTIATLVPSAPKEPGHAAQKTHSTKSEPSRIEDASAQPSMPPPADHAPDAQGEGPGLQGFVAAMAKAKSVDAAMDLFSTWDAMPMDATPYEAALNSRIAILEGRG